MRRLKGAVGVAVAAFALTVANAAYATDVKGSLACASDTTKVLQPVTLTFTQGSIVYSAVTDPLGVFGFHIYGDPGVVMPGYWAVTADLTAFGGPANAALGSVYVQYATPFWQLDPFLVDVPWCGTPPPPPPECPATADILPGAFCPARPLGNPAKECGYFGLPVLDKDDGLSGQTWIATTDAAVAIVKAGGCYNVVVDVKAGDVLAAPSTQGISHVTYCGCPE